MKVAAALPWTKSVWDRLTQQQVDGRLGHAILLVGQEGIGKRLLMREFSQRILCSKVETGPCGTCSSCLLFIAGSHPDLLMVEPEEVGKQIKIEQIRKVTEFVNTTPQKGNHKVVLLGPSEAMNNNSSNALLKSLEEPSGKVTLLLYSHQPSGLLATIKSRCQQYTLSSPSWDEGLRWLNENSHESSLDSVLRLAKGSPLKALNMIEQDIHVQYMQFCQSMLDLTNGGSHWNELLAKWKGWDTGSVLQWFYELILDIQKLKSGLGRDMLSVPELAVLTGKVASSSRYDQLQTMLDKALFAQKALNGQANPNPQMLIETLLIDWISLLAQARN
ncbi:MAG: DNA polymerase-3 subunit delta' [Bermanella sp.]|jgi:DNA polymerase-3 subunit delta'